MTTKIKRKFKLKKKFRRLILYLVIITIFTIFGINRYNIYKYHQTDEYKLLKIGYNEETVNKILNLTENNRKYLINESKIDYIMDLINEKYYIDSNLVKYIDFYSKNGKYDFKDIVAIVNVNANNKWYEGTKDTDTTKGLTILTNKFNLLDESYDPGELKKFTAAYSYGEVSANIECYNAFIKMAKAAKKDKIILLTTSGYRDYKTQEKVYNDILKKKGETYADSFAARPGASEHETGLALDIFAPSTTTDMFHTTDAYKWLCENAEEYGFILRYPEKKEYLTGYTPESWHYRYVGVALAKKVKEEGITYDEYYAYYLANE